MRKQYPSETQDRFMLRLPDGMRERIKAAADANGRTMTAEIVWRLERSLSGVEAWLASQDREINNATDLAYTTHEHAWALDNEVFILMGWAARVSAHLGIEGPSEADAVPAKPKRKKG